MKSVYTANRNMYAMVANSFEIFMCVATGWYMRAVNNTCTQDTHRHNMNLVYHDSWHVTSHELLLKEISSKSRRAKCDFLNQV